MSSGVTLKELNRLFDFLKQSKVNDEMTVLITNDMCKSLYDLMENCVKYQDKLQSNWNSLREWLKANDRYSQGYFKQVLKYMNILEGVDNENNRFIK